jgi:hypothetical protein
MEMFRHMVERWRGGPVVASNIKKARVRIIDVNAGSGHYIGLPCPSGAFLAEGESHRTRSKNLSDARWNR